MIKTVAVIGMGKAGMKVVEKLGQKGRIGDTFYSTIAVSTETEDLKKTSISKKVQIGVQTCRGVAIGESIKEGKEALVEQLGNVMEAIGSPDCVLIVAGFGSGVATGATVELATTLQKLNNEVIPIVIKPFKFESNRSLNNFQQGTQELTKNMIDHRIFEADKIVKNANRQKRTLRQAFEIIDDAIAEKIQKAFLA